MQSTNDTPLPAELPASAVPRPLDLTNCDHEPIHIPGSIQPHGLLFALQEPDFILTQLSTNTTSFLGAEPATLLGQPLAALLEPVEFESLQSGLQSEDLEANPLYAATVTFNGHRFHAIVHRRQGVLILELEPTRSEQDISFHNLYALLRTSIARLEDAVTTPELCQRAALEARQITGFDKVMIYQFDPNWNGLVIAEAKVDELESYLDLRFPASDIPQQARQLYMLNRLRLIADVNYQPVPIVPTLNPTAQAPLDMSFSALRSVSPIHLEYLRNMGVTASMSISIIKDNALWGLIACHHRTPRYLPYQVRTAAEFLGEILALQLTAKANSENYTARIHWRDLHLSLLEAMAGGRNFVDGLTQAAALLLEFGAAPGAALYFEEKCVLLGETPTEAEVHELAQWLAQQPREEIFQTADLAQVYPAAAAYATKASGLLAVSISQVHPNYVLWFRPEVVRTVKWSGDPQKPVEATPDGLRLHPRKSFALWQETVRGQATPWPEYQLDAVAKFRTSIIAFVLRYAEERAQLAQELEYSNRELEAFSYSVSHDLRAPFRHITGYADLLVKRASVNLDETSLRYLDTISNSARYAGTLVDNLLAFSRMGRAELEHRVVDMEQLLREVVRGLESETAERTIEWHIGVLPKVLGDTEMLRLALYNLVANAIKYSQPRALAQIEIGCEVGEQEAVFHVRDNGVGFDMQYAGKLFGVFQRLHGVEEFEGTGIGLANVKRIVTRHGGRVWADSVENEGATFYFSLPLVAH